MTMPVHRTRPVVIQGGMGVGISGWQLARAVSQTGQLGVVSGVSLEILMARRLQDGDPGGHVRRAMAAFPVPEVTEWILASYFVEGGIPAQAAYKQVPRLSLAPAPRVLQLVTVANFVEVFLAKEGHDGFVGINYLRKIELPIPAGLYGAMLAGVDYVLMGAGSPAELPAMIAQLSVHRSPTFAVKVMGAHGPDAPAAAPFDPADVLDPAALPAHLAELDRPQALAIVASVDLAAGLASEPRTRPDGFVVEGPTAGGHNAPPRGPFRLDAAGEPVYDERDDVDLQAVLALGLPVWVAGGQATPAALRDALSAGLAGIQVGTAFAYSAESGFDADIKSAMRAAVSAGDVAVLADHRVSPTGFPFRVAHLQGSLADPVVREARTPVCDLGVLRTAYVRPDGGVDYRCPAEPARSFARKGGREIAAEGRVCLCNALFAAAGHPQRRPGGYIEPPLVTSGSDLEPVRALLAARPNYAAADVVHFLLDDELSA